MNDDGSPAELRRAALSGARWTALARLVAESAAFVSSILLARLIPPEEFGHAAVALIVVALAAVLAGPGLTAPIVQRRELGGEHVASTLFLGLVCGVAAAAATAAFAVWVAPAVFGDRTADLILLASIVWLLVGAGSTSQALLQRELRFRRQAGIEVAAVLAGVAAALVGAVAGLDGEALVLGPLTLAGCLALLSVVSAKPPSPRPTRRGVDDVRRDAAPVAASSLVYLGYRNVDYAILAGRLSAAQVGFYWRAYQLGVGYQSKISRIMLQVSFPVYARAKTLAEVRAIRLRIVRAHATALVPLLAAFAALAPVLVPWLFGDTWEPAVVPAQILAVAGMAEAVVTGIGPLLVALGHAKRLLHWNLFLLVTYSALIAVLAPHGITVVATGVATFGVASVVVVQVVLLRPVVGLSLADLWRDVRAGLAAGAAVFVVVVGLRRALEPLELAEPVLLAALGTAALGTYVGVLKLGFGSAWRDLTAVVRRSKPLTGSTTGSR